ncbi:MAG: glycosyltransferase family 39 protein [Phycisphaeraceae bacterium]
MSDASMTFDRERGIDLQRLARSPAVWLAGLLLGVTLVDLWVLGGRWAYVHGYEIEWIARGLAGGHGFSLPGDRQWLFAFETGDPDAYFPTAWQAPLYPAWMALWLHLLGENGQLVVMLGQVAFVRATCGVVYLIGRRLWTPTAGLAAAAVLALSPYTHVMAVGQIGNATLAGLLVALAVWMGLWCLDRPSPWRGGAWGTLLGVTALTYAGTQLLAPAAAVVLVCGRGRGGGRAWLPALALLVATAAVVAPWTVRNYVVFDAFVPIRTGVGQIAQMGNPVTAQTFAPDVRFTDEPAATPPWRAGSIGEAMERVRDDRASRMALTRHSRALVEQQAPPDYAHLNEAQRDDLYLAQAGRFAVNHPGLTAAMSVRKLAGFFFDYWRLPGAVAVLALAGVLLVRWDVRMTLVAVWILAFALPYAVTFPYFYRYRYPIEPLLALLAGVAVVAGVRAVWMMRGNIPVPSPTPLPREGLGEGAPGCLVSTARTVRQGGR